MHLKTNTAEPSLYMFSNLSNRVCVKTSSGLVSPGNPYTTRPALALGFARLLKCALFHEPQTTRTNVTEGTEINFGVIGRRKSMRRGRFSLDTKDFATFAA